MGLQDIICGSSHKLGSKQMKTVAFVGLVLKLADSR